MAFKPMMIYGLGRASGSDMIRNASDIHYAEEYAQGYRWNTNVSVGEEDKVAGRLKTEGFDVVVRDTAFIVSNHAPVVDKGAKAVLVRKPLAVAPVV